MNFKRSFYARNTSSKARMMPLMLLITMLLFSPSGVFAQASESGSDQVVYAQDSPDDAIINPQRSFNEANFLLEQKQYSSALSRYQAIEAAGFVSGPLLLNTGLAYLRIQEPGRALFYFERAKRYSQTRSQAERAAEFVRENLHQQFAEPPVLATFTWFERMQFYVGTEYFALLTLVLLNLAVLCWVIHWFTAGFRRFLRYGATVLVLLSLPAGAAALYAWQNEGQWERAMVVETGHELREQPDHSAESVLMVYPGFPMLEYASHQNAPDGWSFVQMSNGLRGWLPQESFMRYPALR